MRVGRWSYTLGVGKGFHRGAFMIYFSSSGQGLMEYALVILLVGLAVVVLMALFGSSVGNMFSTVIAGI